MDGSQWMSRGAKTFRRDVRGRPRPRLLPAALNGDVVPALPRLVGDIAEIGEGRGDGEVLERKIADEYVLEIVLAER